MYNRPIVKILKYSFFISCTFALLIWAIYSLSVLNYAENARLSNHPELVSDYQYEATMVWTLNVAVAVPAFLFFSIKHFRVITRIKNLLRKFNLFHYSLFVMIISLITAFFWFQVRPANIKSSCANQISVKLNLISAKRSLLEWQRAYDLQYDNCLHKNGL